MWSQFIYFCHVILFSYQLHRILQSVVLNHSYTYSITLNIWSSFSNIKLELNGHWTAPDRDYTPSRSVLSATWPGLWHGMFLWKVVSDSAVNLWNYKVTDGEMHYSDYHCSSPAVLACGSTKVSSNQHLV